MSALGFLEGRPIDALAAKSIAQSSYRSAWIFVAAAATMAAASALQSASGLGPLAAGLGAAASVLFLASAVVYLMRAYEARRAYWHASQGGEARL